MNFLGIMVTTKLSVLQSCQVVIRNEREILNVVTSKAPKVASRPAGGMWAWGTGSPQRGTGRSPGEKTCE